jgi:hypothetical protein
VEEGVTVQRLWPPVAIHAPIPCGILRSVSTPPGPGLIPRPAPLEARWPVESVRAGILGRSERVGSGNVRCGLKRADASEDMRPFVKRVLRETGNRINLEFRMALGLVVRPNIPPLAEAPASAEIMTFLPGVPR